MLIPADLGFMAKVKSMGEILLYLLVMVFAKAFIYLALLTLYKYVKKHYFPQVETKNEDEHLFDYESEWESQDECDDDKVDPNENVVEDEKCQDQNEFIPDEEFSQATDELMSMLRERKSYKGLTAAEFEHFKLGFIPSRKTGNVDNNHSYKGLSKDA